LKIPLLDLRAQFASIRQPVIDAVIDVLDSQVCINGPRVTELERAVAEYCGVPYAVGVSSGTDGLLAAFMSLEIGPGAEVITSPFTFFATAGCIQRVGARPVFADIDPRTFNLDPSGIRACISPHTRAVVPVHLFGQMADIDPIRLLAARHGLDVVEDAAQAIGATYEGHKAGSFGKVGVFSFFPSKNLGAAGDAGMAVTRDPALHQRLMLMRNHGMEPKYFHKFVGGNFRLDAIQAAVLLAKLPHLDAWSEARRRNAAYYTERFAGSAVTPPFIDPRCGTVVNQYVIRCPRRDELRRFLEDRGIGSEIYYPVPLHLQECFRYLGYKRGDFPEAERAADEVLALPVYPGMTPEMLEAVASTVLEFYD